MLHTLDAAAVRRWCTAGLDGLRRCQREIDELNVYPVPDGDTGTNLVLTLTSARDAVDRDAPDGCAHGQVLSVMARGALLGARGNSGVIVAQILRGLADGLGPIEEVRGRELTAALRRAVGAAYEAVAEPVEGTILSVAAASAAAAERTQSDELPTVVRAAVSAAVEALARTPEQLPVLARAGVVDAGGRGLVVLLDALQEIVTGVAAPAAVPVTAPPAARHESSTFAYEVQYLLDAPESTVDTLRTVLGGLGDSLVIVGDTGTWNVHVHVDDVGAAIEAGIKAGRPYRISVTRFADQTAPPRIDRAGRGFVAVAPGPGLATLFAAEGAVAVDPTPSTVEILEAVRAVGAGHVVVLPNDPNSQAVANAAAAEAAAEGVVVRVIPTRCAVQALAALAVRDPARPFEDDVIAMAEAAGACRYAEVTTASREALTVAGRCRPGDILALVDGEVNLIGTDVHRTSLDLLDRLLSAGGELVTLIAGADAPDGLTDALCDHVAQAWPFVEVHVFPGGQPHYPLLVGVE